MIRRLQSMFIWNAHHRVHNAQVQHYYSTMTPRNEARKDARREFDDVLCRISVRM
jgi:hypothetical protein